MTLRSEKVLPQNDNDLLDAYRNGDSGSFELLIRRYEKPLFTFILRMIGERNDAEDIFQDVMSHAVANIESYTEMGKFGSWMFGIAHHLCVDRFRKKRHWKFDLISGNSTEGQALDKSFLDPQPLPDVLLEEKELKEMIEQAVKRLSPEQREVFLLRQHSDLTFREIADLVGRPLNTVLGQMRLAVLSLREYFQKRMI